MDTLKKPDTQLETKGLDLARLSLELKADFEARTISGYAATWDLDRVNDRIRRGAFAKSIELRHKRAMEEFGRSRIRFLWQHEHVLGPLLDIKEDDIGLWVHGRISRTTLGNDTMELLRDGAIDQMSIGYNVPEGKGIRRNGVRDLEEVDLHEFSIVIFPANTKANILTVKSAFGDRPELELRARMFVFSEVPSSVKCMPAPAELTEQEGTEEMSHEEKAGRTISSSTASQLKHIAGGMREALKHIESAFSSTKKLAVENGYEWEDEGHDGGSCRITGDGKLQTKNDEAQNEQKGVLSAACPHCGTSVQLKNLVAADLADPRFAKTEQKGQSLNDGGQPGFRDGQYDPLSYENPFNHDGFKFDCPSCQKQFGLLFAAPPAPTDTKAQPKDDEEEAGKKPGSTGAEDEKKSEMVTKSEEIKQQEEQMFDQKSLESVTEVLASLRNRVAAISTK